MGTGGPQVTIRAATLAGGEKNQDRYAYGDGWAFVLDGASSFATAEPEHDGGWYAERLKNALVHGLTSRPGDGTTDIVARAIEVAASAHEDPETCPTSTIAMARWSCKEVEIYVLGDSVAVLIEEDGSEVEVTDSRMSEVAPDVRAEYRRRLAKGHGFDAGHRELLQDLQARQVLARNRRGGYWIAGATPTAAHRAVTRLADAAHIRCIVLASDGAARAIDYGIIPSWSAGMTEDPARLLLAAHQLEATDQTAKAWPRSKVHDDKTVLAARVAAPSTDVAR